MVTPRRGVALLALVAALLLSGCGEQQAAQEPQAPVQTAAGGVTFNQTDVEFATQMIPHHAQAVAMVVMANGRSLDDEVAGLMDEIREAQVPEIEQMSDLLGSWGEPVPATMLDHSNAGHEGQSHSETMREMGAEEMPGMMGADDMATLESASDAEFQRLWVEMMVEHHQGAIAMAEKEIADGENAETVALAEDIVASQSAEIERMEQLVG